MLRIYGTITSPYVRRVRIVAKELGLGYELVDTATDAGQATLRQRTPIWKVPAAEIDGELVLDSHTITELLVTRANNRAVPALAIEDVAARNFISVTDGALDSLINTFYLAKEGLTPDRAPYLQKQNARAESALTWLEGNLAQARSFGLPAIALGTALAWMRFRDAYPIARHPKLVDFLGELESRASFAETQPA
jgi:glutathione S-transferase